MSENPTHVRGNRDAAGIIVGNNLGVNVRLAGCGLAWTADCWLGWSAGWPRVSAGLLTGLPVAWLPGLLFRDMLLFACAKSQLDPSVFSLICLGFSRLFAKFVPRINS